MNDLIVDKTLQNIISYDYINVDWLRNILVKDDIQMEEHNLVDLVMCIIDAVDVAREDFVESEDVTNRDMRNLEDEIAELKKKNNRP